MTVNEILNAEYTEEEINKLITELTEKRQMLFKEKRKNALIAFEKAYENLVKISPFEAIEIEFINDEGMSYIVDILDVLENYFINASTKYNIE